MSEEPFAPPLSKLRESGIGNTPQPTAGQGLVLDGNGKIDGSLLKDATIALSKLLGATWNAYTPVWSGGGTPPALGNGTIVGRWQQVGHLVTVTVLLTMGSTTTFGTSFWTISLPLTGVQNGSFIGGDALAFDSSAGVNYAGCSLLFSNSVIPSTVTSNAALYAAVTNYAAAVPFTWATGDTLGLSLAYESF